METYFAHGKLLLSAEYTILHGAKGIALPLNRGQRLHFFRETKREKDAQIKWTAFDQNNYPWFEAIFNKSDTSILQCKYKGAAAVLQNLFKRVPSHFFEKDCDYRFETYLDFDKSWGWGTSSTLVSLIAQCTGANPYELYKATFQGSGFDLACAIAESPILYNLDRNGNPKIEPIAFSPSFKNRIFFVYLGKKQSSLTSIRGQKTPSGSLINKISEITQNLQLAQNNEPEFRALLDEHEDLLSIYLGMPTIKSQHFPHMQASIKSLGAWGGDFVMMVGEEDEILSLKQLGYPTLFKWDEIML